MSGYYNERPDQNEPDYLSALGLNQAPFSSAYVDEFFYLGDAGKQRDLTLHQLLQQNNLLLVIAGEHGIGKTSLLKRFINTAQDNWSVCHVQANAMMDAVQLLASIAHGFGLQVTGQPATALQDALYQYLVSIRQNDQIPVLLIDDAHELPRDALETLFTLADTETGEGSLLRMILFCEPQIEIMLESPSIQPLRKRITHTLDIPALSEEQAAEYIKHRLAVSGFTGTSPFKPGDIRRIYQVSHGVPARINELAHLHLLSEEYGATDPEILPEEFTRLSFNKKHIAAGIVVIIIIFTGLFLQNSVSKRIKNEQEQQQLTITIPPAIDKPSIENSKENIEQADTSPDRQQIQPLAEPGQQPTTEASTGTTDTVIQKPVAVITARIRSTLPNPVTGSRNKQSILINGDGFSQETDVIVGWTGNKKKLDHSQVSYENRNQLRIQITVGSKADNWTVQTRDPVYGESNIHEFKVTAAPVSGLQGSAWIKQQEPDHFTLQLLGTYNKYSLTSFAKQPTLEKDTAFFTTQRNGKSWYTLIHGHFVSREAAEQAIQSLPESLQKTEPWIRRFDGIQSALKVSKTAVNDVPEPGEPILNNISQQPQSLDLTAHAAWLWSQNPAHYTIQLLGGHNLDALHTYMQQHQLQKQASFYRTRRNGQQWFVLLYGSYPDRNQALAAIEKLPEEIRKTHPWPRPFSNIHTELSSQ